MTFFAQCPALRYSMYNERKLNNLNQNKCVLWNNDENEIIQVHMTDRLFEADLFAFENFWKSYSSLIKIGGGGV